MMSLACGIFLFAVIQQSGCNRPSEPLPPPTIEVQRTDTTEAAGITVMFRSHSINEQRKCWVTLNSPEEIEQYKKQVEFLLSRLDETLTRMNVHEQPPKEVRNGK
jgi:hypothetical protein